MKRLASNQRGQVFALTVVVITACLGMAAFVLDVGSWFREHRHTQRISDAAALAGAQELPSADAARAAALDYASRNGGCGDGCDVTITTTYLSNDTIAVTAHRTAPLFFAKLIPGVPDPVPTPASAKARSGLPSAAKYVAPIAVNHQHPMLQPPCNPICQDDTEITLNNLHGPGAGDSAGAFSLLDLRKGGDGSAGSGSVSDWMVNGYKDFMDLGIYDSEPSAMFNSSDFQAAITSLIGKEVLLPVYDPPIVLSGSNAEFNIVGWVGFVITDVEGGGSGRRISGHFTTYIAEGIQGGASASEDFGVRIVALVE
jgi:hypothetical protein